MVGLATVFGAGGGTSSYAEAEAADVIVMWGSNARNAHPIFFHHVLQAVERGAELYVVDPRRSETARFADRWLGLHVGTDIALANTVGREIIDAGLVHTDFRTLFEKIAPEDGFYQHEATWHDDNGHSHVRASLVGPSLSVPLVGGQLTLGTWQQIVLLDLDSHPRTRRVVVQVMGM